MNTKKNSTKNSIKEYDLTNPTKVISSTHPIFKLQSFNLIHEKIHKAIQKLFFSQLRLRMDWTKDFNNDLFDSWLNNISNKNIFLEYQYASTQTKLLIRLNHILIDHYIHHSLGGTDKTSSTKPQIQITTLETQSINSLIEKLIPEINKAWDHSNFQQRSIETDFKFLNIFQNTDEVLSVQFNSVVDEGEGKIELLYSAKDLYKILNSSSL